MATKQGMCKNCGSLIVFDDRNENCECVFCHCIFPGEEAVKILENPDDYTFANEEIQESGNQTHYYVTKVSPDIVESAVARQDAMKAREDKGTIKPSDFEISPNDVKAPLKLTALIIGAAAVIVLVIVAISLPLYKSRTALDDEIRASIDGVVAGVADVDTSTDESGRAKGYTIYGQTCQNIKIALSSDITEDSIRTLFTRYTDLRASKANISDDKMKGVTMEIYVNTGVYTVTGEGGNVNVEFAKDEVPETTSETK
ncbi:hypothetical protein SAMN02910456_01173 [Ruminococcaceae bacterium YRB3002]|nr:hypothetical protein SAMN02910456_01173 [Ruminococcaceae bacterium YRB3002]